MLVLFLVPGSSASFLTVIAYTNAARFHCFARDCRKAAMSQLATRPVCQAVVVGYSMEPDGRFSSLPGRAASGVARLFGDTPGLSFIRALHRTDGTALRAELSAPYETGRSAGRPCIRGRGRSESAY